MFYIEENAANLLSHFIFLRTQSRGHWLKQVSENQRWQKTSLPMSYMTWTTECWGNLFLNKSKTTQHICSWWLMQHKRTFLFGKIKKLGIKKKFLQTFFFLKSFRNFSQAPCKIHPEMSAMRKCVSKLHVESQQLPPCLFSSFNTVLTCCTIFCLSLTFLLWFVF